MRTLYSKSIGCFTAKMAGNWDAIKSDVNLPDKKMYCKEV